MGWRGDGNVQPFIDYFDPPVRVDEDHTDADRDLFAAIGLLRSGSVS